MSRVDVTIDRLVLRGLDPAARTAFVEGLRSELARALADPVTRANLSSSGRTPVLRLGRMPLRPGISGARNFGMTIARAVSKGGKR
jgi:hypothetical protein